MKKPFGSSKPRKFAPSGDRKFGSGGPGFKPKKNFSDNRPGGEPGERRPYGDKPAWKSDRPAWKSGAQGGGDRPRPYSDAGERRAYGDKPAWKKDKPAFKSDRPAWKSDRPGGGSDRPKRFDDKPRPFGDKPAWKKDRSAFKSDRPGGDDRPRRYDDRPKWQGDKPAYKSDRPAWKSDRPAGGDRPRYEGGGEGRPFGGKPAWKSDRPGGFKSDRPSWKSDRPGGSSEKPRPYGDKPSWKSDRPAGGFDKPKPYGDKPSWKSDRPSSSGGDRPRTYGDKPAWKADRPAWKSDRPSAEHRPYSDKPAWKSDKPSFKMEQPAWKPDEEFDSIEDKITRDTVTVPYNKKNREEADDATPRRGFTEKFSRPNYNKLTDAKTLIVTLEDTHNVPVRLIWIYDSMVGDLPDGEPAPGDTVYVYDQNNRFVGSAIYNPHSRIRARIFSLTRRMFDQAYVKEMIEKAIATRRQLGLLTESCRAIFGEGDGLPGLIADKIGDYLVIQPLTYAVNRHLSFIVDQLNNQLAPEGIVVRTDVPIRAKEGLTVEPPAIHGNVPERVEIREEGSVLFANPSGGQKTGLFLDQRLNRAAMKPFCEGARVLDLFCHVGGWAMRAARYGAAEVVGVDSSESALDLARAGATANGFGNVTFVEDDVFEYLRKIDAEPENHFDIIVCDPPAFAKTRSHYEEAFRAYLSLNYLVMKKLRPGGVLITCSCSQAVSAMEFNEAILTSARNARMQFQILERRGAPQDHPVLLGLPESEYLKCFVMKRVE